MKTDRYTLTPTESSAVVDLEALRAEVRTKYAEVATNPDGKFHFHTGRPLATKLGSPTYICEKLCKLVPLGRLLRFDSPCWVQGVPL